MKYLLIKLVIIAFLLIGTIGYALPPKDEDPTNPNPYSKMVDTKTFINANNILMFVTNHGNFGRDLQDIFGHDAGTFFPFNTLVELESGVLDNYAMYAAGLWLGGKVNGQVRVSISDYSSEYAGGPILDGGFFEDWKTRQDIRVYKLYSDSLENNPNQDYLDWPQCQGAPVDESGQPQMHGSQMLWAVFNDADPSRHTNNNGSTLPLGVEVHQTMWAHGTGSTIYIKYKLFNMGNNIINDFYISLWADPDLGGASDDLVGCDTASDLFYCYNADNNDEQYGSRPPALGFKIVYGPVVPSDGDNAFFDGHWISGYKNLDMTAFSKQHTGSDPVNAQETYNFMQGLNYNGTPYIYGGAELKYMCSGNPLNGSGDTDSSPSDRRMMASMGPMIFAPGDSQFVFIKMAIAGENDRLSSLSKLRYYLNSSYTFPDPGTYSCVCDCTPGNVDGIPGIDIMDIAYLIDYKFKQYLSGPWPAPIPYATCNGDVDCNCEIDIMDIIQLIDWKYKEFYSGTQIPFPPPCTCTEWIFNCGQTIR
jgi:hypothetical protein